MPTEHSAPHQLDQLNSYNVAQLQYSLYVFPTFFYIYTPAVTPVIPFPVAFPFKVKSIETHSFSHSGSTNTKCDTDAIQFNIHDLSPSATSSVMFVFIYPPSYSYFTHYPVPQQPRRT
jgi:hypothetical protein